KCGHVSANPTTALMKSRRRMLLSRGQHAAICGCSIAGRKEAVRGVGPMSALGQKRTCAVQDGMSALPLIATPKADTGDHVSTQRIEVIPRPTSFSGVFEMGPSRRSGFLDGRRDPLRVPLALFEIEFQPPQE